MMLDNYFKEQLVSNSNKVKVEFETGEKIQGTVVAIDDKSVFLDINSKSEGIINREELSNAEGGFAVKIGDQIEAYFLSEKNGEVILTVKMSGKCIAGHLEDAYRSGIPVEGRVVEERKGGYLVKISDKDAFCPYSQMDLFSREPAAYVNNVYSFAITQMNRSGIVLSRRRLLEKERIERVKYLQESLKENDLVTGTVVNVKDFGIFVDLDGCEGFIPISELSWGHIENPSEILKSGDCVKVTVKKLDWGNNKITLSFRSAQTSWDEVAKQFPRGKLINGKVTRLVNFGAFVELERGIEGLIHISEIEPGRKINHPQDSLNKGDIVPVVVEMVDKENKRISLVRDFSSTYEESYEEGSIKIGDTFKGTVEAIKSFGLFVRITPLERGLIHFTHFKENVKCADLSVKALDKRYPIGAKVNVVIKDISDDGKISLILEEQTEHAEEIEWKDFKKKKIESSQSGFSLADAFNNLNI